ncbi:MAG: GNAT family N-acetyltransferase [Candidatus Promineifilaceae bacterium]|nr:GNAT family N-acetyltransferase [Candidatus Promineifilaceae bacterium]
MTKTSSLAWAFEALIQSHLLARRQRESGSRLSKQAIVRVRYDYERNGQRHLRDHFFINQLPASAALATIRQLEPASDHQIVVVGGQAELMLDYMAAGCSFRAPAHMLMFRNLDHLPPSDLILPKLAIRRAARRSDGLLLSKVDDQDLIGAQDITDATLDYYLALHEGQPVAMARQAWLTKDTIWVSHVYTQPPWRRQGIATALTTRLLTDAADWGARWSLLLATEMSVRLYQRLGYQTIAPVRHFVMH